MAVINIDAFDSIYPNGHPMIDCRSELNDAHYRCMKSAEKELLDSSDSLSWCVTDARNVYKQNKKDYREFQTTTKLFESSVKKEEMDFIRAARLESAKRLQLDILEKNMDTLTYLRARARRWFG